MEQTPEDAQVVYIECKQHGTLNENVLNILKARFS